jgi:uncharacterized protein YjbJ (UPF0337 family)
MGLFDKVKHQAEEMLGKGKEAVGDATDNSSLKGEGKTDQASGQVKQGMDDIKDKGLGAVGETKDKLSDN